MELTISHWCTNPDCMGYGREQVETIKIRRRQTKKIKCGYCGNLLVEIQANRKHVEIQANRKHK